MVGLRSSKAPEWWTPVTATRLVRDLEPAVLAAGGPGRPSLQVRKAVLRAIADRVSAQNRGWCWPSYAQLADDALVAENSVRLALRRLRAAGLVESRKFHDPPPGLVIPRKGRTTFFRLRPLIAAQPPVDNPVDNPVGTGRLIHIGGSWDPQGRGSVGPPGRGPNGRNLLTPTVHQRPRPAGPAWEEAKRRLRGEWRGVDFAAVEGLDPATVAALDAIRPLVAGGAAERDLRSAFLASYGTGSDVAVG